MPIDVIDPLHPYVSQHAARVLADSPECGWVEFDGSLAFFDISGFTTMTERLARLGRAGAEHINDILNLVFQRLIDEVFRFGGDVLEFGGDAMVELLESIVADVRPDELKPFVPPPKLLSGIVRQEGQTFRARGDRQVPAMRKRPFVRVPERFEGLV